MDQSQSLFSRLADLTGDALFAVNEAGAIEHWSPTAEKFIGDKGKAYTGAPLLKLLPKINPAALQNPTAYDIQSTLLRIEGRDDRQICVRLSEAPFCDGLHRIVTLREVNADAQFDDSAMRDQLDETRRLEAIGALSAGIAHEINTPIQFIGDNLAFLQDAAGQLYSAYKLLRSLYEAVGDDPTYTNYISAISDFDNVNNPQAIKDDVSDALTESIEGIEQVREIVLVMKDFAHPGSGEKDIGDLNKIINSVIKISRHRHRGVVAIELLLDKHLPAVECRRSQIQQVVLNLVLNSIDAIEEKGGQNHRIRIATEYDRDNIRVLISDTGPGVPASLREKIFDPFFTTKAVGKGTGQGLALAKDFIVNGHNGRLSLETTPGFATTFVIELPRYGDLDFTMEDKPHDAAA
ncbi:MAG: ATP-binding protein [Pseudomonadota bacterium]